MTTTAIPFRRTVDGWSVPDVKAIWEAADAQDWSDRGVSRALRDHARHWADAWTTLGALPWELYVFPSDLVDDPDTEPDDPAFERLGELAWQALAPIRDRVTEQMLMALQHAVDAFSREYGEMPPAEVLEATPT